MDCGMILIFDEMCDLYQQLNREFQVLLVDNEEAFFKETKAKKDRINAFIIDYKNISKVFLYKLENIIDLEKSVVLASYNTGTDVVLNDLITDYFDKKQYDLSYKRIIKYIRMDAKIKNQRTKGNDALELITNIYHTSFSVNLDTGKSDIIKIVDPVLEEQMKESTDISIWLTEYVTSGNIHPEDMANFVNVFNLKSLKNKFLTGKRHFEQKYRRKINGIFKWQSMEMIASNSYSDSNPVVVFYERDLEENEASLINEVENKINSVKGVLFVDKSLANRNLLTKLLKEYNVLQASNRKSSFQILNRYHKNIDLVIINAENEYEIGLDYIKEYKKKPYGNIPLLMISKRTDGQAEMEAMKAGAFYYVSKPIDPIKFNTLITNIIKMKENSYLVDALKFDSKSKLYSQEYFYKMAEDIIRSNPLTKFDLTLIEISNYRQILELYGPDRVDELIRYISEGLTIVTDKSDKNIAGRSGTKSIVLLTEAKYNIYDILVSNLNNEKFNDHVTTKYNFTAFKAGCYKNLDTTLSIREDIERCKTAIDSIKDQYNSGVALFDESYVADILKRQRIAESMKDAIEKEQFIVYYQPKHDLTTNKIIGAEALVRWIHPEYGFMNPGLFIPIFESNGFIAELDYYVWRRVCITLNRWKRLNMPMIPISINISRMDFYAFDVGKVISDLIHEFDIDPKYLHLEITESAYVDDSKVIDLVVDKLKIDGFKLELDDFGVGYSNLTSFADMNIDVMKLDMSFLRNETPKKNVVLKNMVELGNGLNLDVLCEGVETEDQKLRLKAYGCKIGQGYLYSKPIPLADFEAYISKNI